MAKLGILASGNGSNFESITIALKNSEHSVACLICDRKNAKAFLRAERLGVKTYYVTYYNRERIEAEKEIVNILEKESIDLVALAGFMRIFTCYIVNKWPIRIINIHPTLLPKYPGAHGIEDSYNSGDRTLGISIHYIDAGMDSGPMIHQESFTRKEGDSLEVIEDKIHAIEHKVYPEILLKLLRRKY